MTLIRTLCSVLFIVFFLHIHCAAQETIVPELSNNYVEKLIAIAKENYPKIKSYQNHINISQSAISKARLSYFDAITLSYVYQPGEPMVNPVNPGTTYFKGVQAGIFLNLGTLLTTPYTVKQARQELLIAQNDQDEYFLNIAADVKKRYYMYVLRISELKQRIKSVQDMENSLNDVKYKFEKGEETFENYNKVQNDLTDHKLLRLQAEANVFIAKADVEELLGIKLEDVK